MPEDATWHQAILAAAVRRALAEDGAFTALKELMEGRTVTPYVTANLTPQNTEMLEQAEQALLRLIEQRKQAAAAAAPTIEALPPAQNTTPSPKPPQQQPFC